MKHPVTGDIAFLSDVESVKRSIRNLVNTNFYEKPFHPEIGSNIRSILFEACDSYCCRCTRTKRQRCN